MLKRYVDNWGTVLMVYSGLKKEAIARFKDGTTAAITKTRYNEFYENLYRQHLQAHGFSYYTDEQDRPVIGTPDNLRLIIQPMYSLVIDEIYLMQVYGKPDLTDKIVVDIGAAVGDTSLFFCRRGAKHVYAYELSAERSRIARENIALNHLEDKVTLFQKAARAEDINKLNPDFIKIDCEGCEYDVLPNLDLTRVSEVVMEYHSKPEPLVEVLKNRGFNAKVKGEIILAKKVHKLQLFGNAQESGIKEPESVSA